MSDLEFVFVLVSLSIPFVFSWKFVGGKKSLNLLGIALISLLFIFFSLGAISDIDKNDSPQLVSQTLIIRWIYLGVILTPSILFFIKLFTSSKKESRILPFYSLEKAIQNKYPGESVTNTKWGFEETRVAWWANHSMPMPGVRLIPKPLSVLLNLMVPIKFAETENAYYIDYRYSNLTTLLIITLLLTYWLTRNLNSVSFSYYLYLYLAVELFLSLFYIFFWQLGLVEIIRKDWLSDTLQGGLLCTFSGKIPRDMSVTLSENRSFKTEQTIEFKRKFILV